MLPFLTQVICLDKHTFLDIIAHGTETFKKKTLPIIAVSPLHCSRIIKVSIWLSKTAQPSLFLLLLISAMQVSFMNNLGWFLQQHEFWNLNGTLHNYGGSGEDPLYPFPKNHWSILNETLETWTTFCSDSPLKLGNKGHFCGASEDCGFSNLSMRINLE